LERRLRALQSLALPFTFIHGDLTDAPAVEEAFAAAPFDPVIHLAARAGVRPSLQQPALYQRVNVEGTVNLLEAARARRAQQAITPATKPAVPTAQPFTQRPAPAGRCAVLPTTTGLESVARSSPFQCRVA
jgi:nucleoside-diphosphate-sugar epimerase